MDPLISAAHACAAEMTRRLSHMPADQIQAQVRAGTISAHQARLHLGAAVVPHEAPRPMVDGDLCASPDDQASGAQLSRWWRRRPGMNVVGQRGPDLDDACLQADVIGACIDLALSPDTVVHRAPCGCSSVLHDSTKTIGARITYHHCAAHSRRGEGAGFSESWNGRAR